MGKNENIGLCSRTRVYERIRDGSW